MKHKLTNRSRLLQFLLYVFIVFCLFVPRLQRKYQWFEVRPLSGAITQPEPVTVTLSGWFSGEYQEKKEKYVNSEFGLRPWFVRLNNQIELSLFNKPRANGVVIGRNGYLYEEKYIRAYYGLDFIGDDSIAMLLAQLEYIQRELNVRDKKLVVVLAAGKATYFPEFLPARPRKHRGKTNYRQLVSGMRNREISLLDLNEKFRVLKGKTGYPLYTKNGIHWTTYSGVMVCNDILQKVGTEFNRPMDSLVITKTKWERSIPADVDIGEGMNLIQDMSEPLPYATTTWKRKKGEKLSALVVGDSYFWIPWGYDLKSAFRSMDFWYYNQEAHSSEGGEPRDVSKLNFAEYFERNDVFILLSTEANLSQLGWGFLDDLEKFLRNSHQKNEASGKR